MKYSEKYLYREQRFVELRVRWKSLWKGYGNVCKLHFEPKFHILAQTTDLHTQLILQPYSIHAVCTSDQDWEINSVGDYLARVGGPWIGFLAL